MLFSIPKPPNRGREMEMILMVATVERPVAFYHRDGLVPAWNFARRYAGKSGHIATLPEIVEMRLYAKPRTDDSPWENWYTSASAEYVGIGSDGRVKIIVAHGVGPMSTITGIKAAYKWEWGDKDRRRHGGRITAQEFLDLEAGKYGKAKVIRPDELHMSSGKLVRTFEIAQVNILDFNDYLDFKGDEGLWRYMQAPTALRDVLLRMRLGKYGYRYLMKHERMALAFHVQERPNVQYDWAQGFDDRDHPYITKVETASNCAYVLPNEEIRKATGEWLYEARVPEDGYALAHLLDIDAVMRVHTQEVGVMLMTSPNVHEWWNGAKFIAVPEGASLKDGLSQGPDPAKAIQEHWQHFLSPVEEGYEPITPFMLKHREGEWFACYPKKFPTDYCMDDGELEFHALSVKQVGQDGTFTVDDDFFLRYKLSQVRDIMPREANSYEILNISTKNAQGLTTVTVRFFLADVDTSHRLPRSDEIARDFDRLMEVYTR